MIPCRTPVPFAIHGAAISRIPAMRETGSWDELQDETGRVRQGYEWIERFATLAPDSRVWRDLADTRDGNLHLDRLPLVVSPRDWSRLERGLRQRAELLDRILQDVYGAQEMIHTGRLPAGVVYASPRFLRSAHGGTARTGPFLRFHAADLIRTPDGSWKVVADRTRLPGGLGLALLGLVGSADVLGDVIDALGLRSTARFATAIHEAWSGACGRAVLIPEGGHTDVDLGWMLRGLSWPVVEDRDLLFRGDRLHRVSLSGYERIESLVEIQSPDGYGREESARGRDPARIDLTEGLAPGALQRINAPGSSLVESPAWTPFLPRLCEHLMGEDLLLESIPTWWCGDRQSLRHVEDRLDRLEVESIIAGRPQFLRPRNPIGSTDEVRIRRHLDLRPECWVAREPIQPSRAPWSSEAGLARRPTVLRMFTVETGSGWQVLPGGLAYAYGDEGTPERIGASPPTIKTVWVDPEPHPSTPGPSDDRPRMHRPSPAPVLSLGMANRLVRLGRTWSQCDHACRCIQTILGRCGDEVTTTRDPVVQILSTHLLRHLGLQGEDSLGDRGSGARLRETRPPTGVPQGWLHGLCDPLLDEVGICHPLLPPGIRGSVEELRAQLHRVLDTPGRDGIGNLPLLLEALRGALLTGFDEEAPGRLLVLGWRWDQALHAGTLLLDLFVRAPHPLPGLGRAVDSILGTGGSQSGQPPFLHPNRIGIPHRLWHPADPRSLLRRLVDLRDALDQVQCHSPGLFFDRSRRGIAEMVIEAERGGMLPVDSPSGAEEALRRIVVRVRRAHEDFSEEFNDFPQ